MLKSCHARPIYLAATPKQREVLSAARICSSPRESVTAVVQKETGGWSTAQTEITPTGLGLFILLPFGRWTLGVVGVLV